MTLIGGAAGTGLLMLKKAWPALWVNGLYAVLTLAMAVYMVPRWHGTGLAAAVLIATVVQCVLLIAMVSYTRFSAGVYL
ncbi:hypothetical protein, partial [Salmonella sp. SAL4445]|uniref:hypothetical protein n=1 Tax=Salmonella sp. SAL4445 TaxID=3159900 RepID=UPI003979EB77